MIDLTIFSLDDAIKHYYRHGPTFSHSIQINNIGENYFPKISAENNTLKLIFDDVSEGPEHWVDCVYTGPLEYHIEQIIDFGKNIRDNSNLVTRCTAGISRSTAAALIALISSGLSIDTAAELLLKVRIQAHPNSRMIQIADNLLNLDGKLINKGKEIRDRFIISN